MDTFSTEVLYNIWGVYNIDVCKLSKNSSFVGAEIKPCIDDIPRAIYFLEEQWMSTEYMVSLIEGLSVWPALFKFLKTTKIETAISMIMKKMDNFEERVTLIFCKGGKSFLKKEKI